jgi:arabinogalactan oligomer / maltooligosaccharide transport system permease protein
MSTLRQRVEATAQVRSGRAPRLRLGAQAGTWITRTVLVVLCFLAILPALWIFSASVEKGSSAIASSLIPTSGTWDNYQHIFNDGLWTWLKNSFIVCITVAVISVLINTLGAYAFSRLKFIGSRSGLMILFLIQIFPQIMELSAIYGLLVKFNLLDTYPGLILVFIAANAFNMWLMKNYIDSIPRELDEAAAVDGANAWQVFFQVLLPLVQPMIVFLFLSGFTGAYNDFVFSSVIMTSPEHYTVAVGLFHEINGQPGINYAYFSAGAVLASLPILIVYMLLQRQLISGLAQGAVKG